MKQITNENFINHFKNLFKNTSKTLLRSGSLELKIQKPQEIQLNISGNRVTYKNVDLSLSETITGNYLKFQLQEISSLILLLNTREKFNLEYNPKFDSFKLNTLSLFDVEVTEDISLDLFQESQTLTAETILELSEHTTNLSKKLKKSFLKESTQLLVDFKTSTIRVVGEDFFNNVPFVTENLMDAQLILNKSQVKLFTTLLDGEDKILLAKTDKNELIFTNNNLSFCLEQVQGMNLKMFYPTVNLKQVTEI
mgnify:CR=1 FL=1